MSVKHDRPGEGSSEEAGLSGLFVVTLTDVSTTLTLMMTSAQVVETSVNGTTNSPAFLRAHPYDHTSPTNDMTPGFKPFSIPCMF